MSDLFFKKNRPWNSVKGTRRFLRTSVFNRAKDWENEQREYKAKKEKLKQEYDLEEVA